MTEPQSASETSSLRLDRRLFLSTAALGLASTAFGRDFGPGAEPVRYPDPDLVSLDPRFNKYKLGNTPIQRIHTGALWAEGPNCHSQGHRPWKIANTRIP